MTDRNVTIVSDLRCLHLPRLLENYDPAAEPPAGDLLLVRCVINEKAWQGAWLRVIITTMKTIKTITLS